MSFPILYDTNLTGWEDGTLGLGVLSDAISCVVEEERNSTYELEMEYPISGIHVDDIEKGCCLYATHDNSGEKQLFEIYAVTKNLTKMTVNARHISYRLNKATLLPCSADTLASAMVAVKGHSIGADDFSFDACGRLVSASWGFDCPLSVRSALGGVRGSLLDTYTGEYEWDNFAVKLHTKRGSNNGVTIEYAKNLTSLEAEEDAGDVFTSCIPYYKCQDETYFYSATPVVSEYTGEYTMCAPLDLTEYFDAPEDAEESWHPTADELTTQAKAYMAKNTVGVPSTNLDVDFVELWQSEEYKNVAPLQEVKLGDTVTVRYPKFGVDVTTKVISVKWDVLANRYSSIELGDAKGSFSKTLLNVASKEIGETEGEKLARLKKQTSSEMANLNAAIANVSGLINGAKGGIFQVTDSNGDGINDGWTIAENTDLSESQKIIKANYAGIGFSTDGGQTYQTAIDYNGIVTAALHVNEIFAKDITATGTITNQSGKYSYTLDHGVMKYYYSDALVATMAARNLDSSESESARGFYIESGVSRMAMHPNGEIELNPSYDGAISYTLSCDNNLHFNEVPFDRFFERGLESSRASAFNERYIQTDYERMYGHALYSKESGGTYTIQNGGSDEEFIQTCAGMVLLSLKKIWFTVRLPERIKMGKTVTIDELVGTCYHPGGGILGTTTGWTSGRTITVTKGAAEDELVLKIVNTDGSAFAYSGTAPSNGPITFALKRIKYTIS